MNDKKLVTTDPHYNKSINVGQKLSDLLSKKGITIKEFGVLMGRNGKSTGYSMLNNEDWKLSDLNKACEILGITLADIIPITKTYSDADLSKMVEENQGPYGRIAMLEQQLESCQRESKLKDELISVLKNK